jgi:hydrogenase maturation protease
MSDKLPIVVIGLGNEFRGDDFVGLFIARKIRDKKPTGVRIIEGVSDGTSLIECWENFQTAILIDCVTSGAAPGKIHRFDALAETIPEKIFPAYSTHAFSITEAVELAGAIGQLPEHLLVYGVEGVNFKTGAEMPAEVKAAAEKVIDLILKDIEKFT